MSTWISYNITYVFFLIKIDGIHVSLHFERLNMFGFPKNKDRPVNFQKIAGPRLELLHLPLGEVASMGWPCFRILAHLAEATPSRGLLPLDLEK